jgi:hypothetical protein
MRGYHGLTGKAAWAAVFLLAAARPIQSQAVPLAKERLVTVDGKQYLLTSRLKGVLLGIFTYGFEHIQAKANLDSTLSRIGRTEGWTVDRITDGNLVTAEKLADYQVFFGDYISNWSSASFPLAGRMALQEFVETRGNGLFIQHSSDEAISTDWNWFRTYALPCHFTGNGPRNAASTGKVGVFKGYLGNPGAVGHPILEGIEWNGKDSTIWQSNELHTFDKPILDSAITPVGWQGLLSLNPASCGEPNSCGNGRSPNPHYDYSGMGGNYPVSWTFPLKKGSIGYFMEGHDLMTMNSMTQAIWDRYFKQFMYYMAGYDTTAVTTAVNPNRKDGLNASFGIDASGITFHPSSQPGVLITKPGQHIVTLYDLSGKKVREERSQVSPVDYDFSADAAGKRGVYVIRVAASGASRTQRLFLQ